MTDNPAFSPGTDDGAVVVSLPVPVLSRAVSAPNLASMTNGTPPTGQTAPGTEETKVVVSNHKRSARQELVRKYRLHVFVSAIFLITVISISLAWHFRKVARDHLYASQPIFFNPRTRELTLTDSTSGGKLRAALGKNIPGWRLPLHCPIVSQDNAHTKECVWTDIATLKVVFSANQGVSCYNVSWQTLGPLYTPHDCVYLDDDVWYGPSNQSAGTFPISGEFIFEPVKGYTLNNNGIFNLVVDFVWLSSSGAFVHVHPDNPARLRWNVNGSNQLCIQSSFSGQLYHKTDTNFYPDLKYTICKGPDAQKTHAFAQNMLATSGGRPYPPVNVLRGTHWSVSSYAQTDNVTQTHVLDLLANASDSGFAHNQITLDGTWQSAHGDLDFDLRRFVNATDMMADLTSQDGRLTLTVSPYFQYTSQNFLQGITSSLFVKDAGGDVPGLTYFHGALAGVLDIFAVGAGDWYGEKIQKLADNFGIKSFRLTYGDGSWLPYKPHFGLQSGTPNMYRKLMTELLASLPGSSLVVEHTARSRNLTSILPVVAEYGSVSGKTCLGNIVETALTLGLMGYPFVMADGIRKKLIAQKGAPTDVKPSKELYIRWLQLASLFPVFQFTVAPWEYDSEVLEIAKNLTNRRQKLVLDVILSPEVQKEVSAGAPILRPVWWLDAQNATVHGRKIRDQFLIGNNLLVAPVLCEGDKERDIYVPPGVWEDQAHGNFVLGPSVLRNYSVSLHHIPVFKKRRMMGETVPQEL